ncbi:MAG: hypothetical protein JWQ07_3016 [Ramlibacter sp.]|nr:hypothetical protein [Ramlibacter sp.]
MIASPKAIAWIERLIWILIYGGLFAIILGVVARPHIAALGWSLMVFGGCVAVAGAVLIWVRSRIQTSLERPT